MKPELLLYTNFIEEPAWWPQHQDFDLLSLQASLHLWLLKRGFSVQFNNVLELFFVWSDKDVMVASERTIDEAMIHVYNNYLENDAK